MSPSPEPAPSFSQRYAQWVVRRRWPVLVTALLAVFALAAGGSRLLMNDDYRYFFKEGNPQLAAFNELQNTYNKNDNILFVLAPKSEAVFDGRALDAVETLTKEAWQIPFAIRVDSISNFQHTRAEGDDLIVEDLVANGKELPESARLKAREAALAEPLLKNRLITDRTDVTGVNVTLELPGKEVGEQTPAVVHARDLVEKMKAQYPDIEIRLTGFVMLNNAFTEASFHDMQTLVPLMYLVIIIAMALLLGSISGVAATVAVIGLSVAATMGATGWAGVPLSPPSAIAPTLIMTLAVADCIHILVSMIQQRRAGLGKREALVESLRINLQPIFLTSLTTVIGFLSLNFSDVQALNDLGNITAFGVTAAFLLSITFLPALMSFLPMRAKARAAKQSGMERLADFVIKRRGPLLVGSSAVILILAAFVARNTLNDEFVKYFDTATQFRQDTDFTAEKLTGIYQLEYSLPAGDSGAISEPAYLQKLDEFAAWFRVQANVVHVDTFSDVMKRLNRNMHGDDPAWHRLPDSRELAAQYLLLYEMSLPYGLDLNNRINVDKSATRFIVTLEDVSTRSIRELTEAGEAWLAANAPAHMSVRGAGPPIMFAYLSIRNSVSMFKGTALAFLLITLTLIVALRSLRYGALSLIPNLIPSLAAFGVWGLLDGQINFGLTIVSALSIGVVVDDTVHFLSKYLRARREKGLSAEDAVRYAFATVGKAMTVTTLVLVSGFMILMLSSFDMNSGMGKLTALTITIALIADFLLLPALLLKLGEAKQPEPQTDRGLKTAPAGV